MSVHNPIDPDLHRHPALGVDEWQLFQDHFAIFPWSELPERARGFEMGCGTGMWSSLLAQRCAHLWAIETDPLKSALAQQNLQGLEHVQVHSGSLEDSGIEDGSMDFAYALSAIQEASHPAELLRACAAKLKPGAPFLLYVCYALDNRPAWYRALWKASDLARQTLSRSSPRTRSTIATALTMGAYLPLARGALLLESLGLPVESLPLSTYRSARFETMRQGAEERFAAPTQARFAADEVRALMAGAGFSRVQISPQVPFWTVLGYRDDP